MQFYCLLLLFDFSFITSLVFHTKIDHVVTLLDVKNPCFGDLLIILEDNLGVIQGLTRPNIEHIQVQLHLSSDSCKISLWLVDHSDVISYINQCYLKASAQ